MLHRYGFQISGTLLAFAILFVLLDKLPEASILEGYDNTTAIMSCENGDSPLNYSDRTAFWVRDIYFRYKHSVFALPYLQLLFFLLGCLFSLSTKTQHGFHLN